MDFNLTTNLKILIVDDNCEMRGMTRAFLGDLTNDVRECCDGADALAAYAAFQPDWVLMDWEMKRMDGIAATGEIRREFPAARILMFTQYDDAELRRAAADAGASGFILKDDLFALREFFARDISSKPEPSARTVPAQI